MYGDHSIHVSRSIEFRGRRAERQHQFWSERDRALPPVLVDGIEQVLLDVRIQRSRKARTGWCMSVGRS